MKDFERILKELKNKNAKRILVQFPEGLKTKIKEISEKLEEEGFESILWLENTYGACDIPINEAKMMGCDAILHIGHTDFGIKSDIPIFYWEYLFDVDPVPIVEREFDKLKNFQRIGLVSSLQYIKGLGKLKRFLEKEGKEVYVYKSEKHGGQILGCRLEAGLKIQDKVDCFICLTTAKFYPLGLSLKTSKPVFVLDFEKNSLYLIENEKKRYEKIILWNLEKFKEANEVGILVSSKIGQFKFPIEIKKKIEKMGKKAYVFYLNEIAPEKLEGIKVDILVNLACPRIGIDDIPRYKIPIINASDLFEFL